MMKHELNYFQSLGIYIHGIVEKNKVEHAKVKAKVF